MRRVILIALCIPAMATAAGLSLGNATHQRKPEPRMIARWDVQPTGVPDDLKAVFFVNAQLGFAAGKNGTIIRTTDEGKTWKRVIERRENGSEYAQIAFNSDKKGWVRSTESLLNTTDRGETWRAASPLPIQINHGYGAGWPVASSWFQLEVPGTGTGIYRTDDDGKSWRKVGAVPENSYQDLFFLDAQGGWAVGRYLQRSIVYTDDGGATWTGVAQEVSQIENKVRFASAVTGWAFGKDGSFILASVDGGKSWKHQPTGMPDYRPPVDISIVNEREVFICTTEAALSTSNGGASWKVIGNFRSETISAISFPDDSHGWIVGRGGFVSHYHLVPAASGPKK